MPALIINIIQHDGQRAWMASPANSEIFYFFRGAYIGDQAESIQLLSVCMQQGMEALLNGIPDVFDFPEGLRAADAVQQLFQTTDQILYINRVIYGAVGEDMLIDDLELVGRALAEVII